MLHSTAGAVCVISFHTETQTLKNTSPKVSWRPDPRRCTKATASHPAQMHLEPRLCAHNHAWARASPEQFKLACWKFGFNFSLQLSLVSPFYTKTCFCPLKTTEPNLGGRGEQRPARERLSRGTKFACPSFKRSLSLGLPY